MTIQEQARLSYYRAVAEVGGHEDVCMVQHVETKEFFVRKDLRDYKREVYEFLYRNTNKSFPKIYEMVEDEGTLILIEEYIPGKSLQDYFEEKGTLPLYEVKHLMLEICRAVAYLHEQCPAIVHRDLKPSNIIRDNYGCLRIVDFNTARYFSENASRDTVILGTKNYAAPEQYGFFQSDVRTDIFSLGVMMNYLLTGRYPKEYIHQGEAEEIIKKSTRFDPQMRYQSVRAMMRDIEKLPELYPEKQEKHKSNTEKHGRTLSNPLARENQRFPLLPPGFRTCKLWKMIISTLVYASLIWAGVTLDVSGPGGEVPGPGILLANKIAFLILFLGLILFWMNYLGIQEKLPLMRRSGVKWKVFGYVVYSIIFCVVIMMILTAVENAA